MPSNVRLKSVKIEAFRGFRDRAVLSLDASTVILTGPNGTGKTSVFDAIQWVLVGAIDRLEQLRTRRNVEHVVSSYRAGERADVTLEFSVGDRTVESRRTGNYSESTLEVVGAASGSLFGGQAEDWLRSALAPHRPEALQTTLSTCGLLQQDVMRSVLEAKPAERHAHISAVLGLSDLADFEKETRESAKRAQERHKRAEEEAERAQTAVANAATHVESLHQRAQHRASVDAARASLQRRLADIPRHLVVRIDEQVSGEAAIELAQQARLLAQQLSRVFDEAREVTHSRNELAPEPGVERLERLQAEVSEAEESLAEAENRHQQATETLQAAEDASEQVARLASAAIPLLGDECPVCGQSINPQEILEHLEMAASETSTLVRLRESVQRSSAEIGAVRNELSAAAKRLAAAQATASAWHELRAREAELTSQLAEMSTPTTRLVERIDLPVEAVDSEGPEVAAFLHEVASLLDRLGNALTEAESTGELDRARSEWESAKRVLEAAQEQLGARGAHAKFFKRLAEAATLARVDITTDRFRAIEPLVTDIYSRLDPHPAFKVIGFEHDTYYGKGTSSAVVRDVTAEVEADPLIVFSASQANIAALSYFLAMSLGAGDRALPFVLLDDPLQSMDDVNVLGFADLCRFIRSERQLVLSTHDRRFANLLQRKLGPRRDVERTIVHNFVGWTRSGPKIESDVLTFPSDHASVSVLERAG